MYTIAGVHVTSQDGVTWSVRTYHMSSGYRPDDWYHPVIHFGQKSRNGGVEANGIEAFVFVEFKKRLSRDEAWAELCVNPRTALFHDIIRATPASEAKTDTKALRNKVASLEAEIAALKAARGEVKADTNVSVGTDAEDAELERMLREEAEKAEVQ